MIRYENIDVKIYQALKNQASKREIKLSKSVDKIIV